uniref:Uncharacterized protein n=1 Tax=Rhizophora mucronata TaxID=61149 RepID=A0A2P2IHW3_RHIMU
MYAVHHVSIFEAFEIEIESSFTIAHMLLLSRLKKALLALHFPV